jgi:hypothetical protein
MIKLTIDDFLSREPAAKNNSYQFKALLLGSSIRVRGTMVMINATILPRKKLSEYYSNSSAKSR